MLFNSQAFLCVFLPIVFTLYYCPIFRKYQIYVLALASFIFYSYNYTEFFILLFISACQNAIFSYLTYQSVYPYQRKAFATLGVICNLSIFIFFKYGGLIYKTFFESSTFGEWILTLPLPIGISFYTFQGISLLVDVMHGEMNEKPKTFFIHFINTVFFISFFPHSISGPIVKARDFFPQIRSKRIRDIPVTTIFRTLILGFFFKTVIADNIQDQTFWIAYPYFLNVGSLQLLVMMIGYSVQIFSDFAGYSLIAIGIAALFGYRLPSNFNYPYIAQSFREFWQRWHISLSSWLKDYLYIPLGGNKKGVIRTYINLFLVMLLGGMWHGAAWNYLAWGCAHGAFLVLERFFTMAEHSKEEIICPNKTGGIIKTLFVFLIVSWAWLFFKLPEASYVFAYTKSFFSNLFVDGKRIGNIPIILFCIVYSLPIFFYHLVYLFNIPTRIKDWDKFEPVIYACLLFLILANGGSSNAFIYFQF